MPGEKVAGVNLVDSDHREDGLEHRYIIRAAGVTEKRRQQRAKRKAEVDARQQTAFLPNQVESVEAVIESGFTTDPAFTTYRVAVFVKKVFR